MHQGQHWYSKHTAGHAETYSLTSIKLIKSISILTTHQNLESWANLSTASMAELEVIWTTNEVCSDHSFTR